MDALHPRPRNQSVIYAVGLLFTLIGWTCLSVSAVYGADTGQRPSPYQASLDSMERMETTLRETLKEWPAVRGNKPPADVQRYSKNLGERVRELIELLKNSPSNLRELPTRRRIHRTLPDLRYTLADLSRAAHDAQIAALEEYRMAMRERKERSQTTTSSDKQKDDEDKNDLRKLLESLFDRRDREEQSTKPDKTETSKPVKSEPIPPPADFQLPLRVSEELVDALTHQTRFLVELSEDTVPARQYRTWVDEVEHQLGRYLQSVHQKRSLAPMYAQNYETHLRSLEKDLKHQSSDDPELLGHLFDSLENQERALGAIRLDRSPRAYDLQQRVIALQKRVDRRLLDLKKKQNS